ncbi:MAG: GNAT family N-acetyltransferase [Eubacteriales bacterium]|nr:GNAT family N-acetyltransferase [Eubacteriales bacterium]
MNVHIDISGIELRTDRLLLRPWRESDVDDFFAYASVDGVGQMAGWAPHKSKEESAQILKRFIEGKKTFAVVHKGKLIGSVGIEKYNEEEFPEFQELRGRELGAVLAKDYWGQGIMPEALMEVMRYLFEELDLDFLLAGHFPENIQSARMQEKCGFVPYKEVPYTTQMGTATTSIMSICMNPAKDR